MRFTKRQKIMLVVFGAGLVGLAIDRVFVRSQGGPAAASAGSSPAAPASPLPAPGRPAAPQETLAAQCLDLLWSDKEVDFDRVRNPFSLPSSWSNGTETPVRTSLDPGALFARGHQLYVLIDDRLLRPGQDIDGFRLVSVGERSALFERAGTRVTLELVDE